MPDKKFPSGYKEDAEAVSNRIRSNGTTPSSKAPDSRRQIKLDFGLHGYSRSDLPQHTGKTPEPKAPAVAAPTGKTGVKLDFKLNSYDRSDLARHKKKPATQEPEKYTTGGGFGGTGPKNSGIGSDAKYPTRSSGIGSDSKYPTSYSKNSGIGSDAKYPTKEFEGMMDTKRETPKAAPSAPRATPSRSRGVGSDYVASRTTPKPAAPTPAPEAPKPSTPQNSEDGPWGKNPARMVDNSADLSWLFGRKK